MALPDTPRRIACIGECMIELSQLDLDSGAARIGFAGDTLNTAAYLARLGANVAYVTNLGVDAFSTKMMAVFRDEGIDCGLIGLHDTRLPGLYSIEVDKRGERSFRYWRDSSAARTLFSGVGATIADLDAFDVIYLSGITLAILPEDIRQTLIARLAALRDAGRTIVFDTNYRPRLWPDPATARAAFERMWKVTSLGLPSFDDEAMLYPGTTPDQVVNRIRGLGVDEVVLKNGAEGPMILHEGPALQMRFPVADRVVDTSGAGDSFNAGYLKARLDGKAPDAAALAGHHLACHVIAHHGALIAKAAMPSLVRD
jgi:2-dehydro-3-deoxygluconokinase